VVAAAAVVAMVLPELGWVAVVAPLAIVRRKLAGTLQQLQMRGAWGDLS
jgi:hypothetical protein